MLQFKTKKTNYLRLYIVIIMTLLLTPFEFIFAQMKKPASDEVQKLFLKAVEANDVEKVKLFLQNDASANYFDTNDLYWRDGKDGGDPLIRAIRSQANDVAVFLIQYDRMVLVPRPVNGKESFIQGPSRITRDITLIHTPLEYAINSKNEKMIDILLQEIFNPTQGNSKLNETIKTFTLKTNPIANAMNIGDWNTINKLKGYGFKVAQGDLDKNLYNYIGVCSNYNYCKVLLDMGANPNYKYFLESDNGHPELLTPVLISAARSGCVEMQKLLIEKGADINAIQSKSGIMDGYNSWNTLSINVQKENNLEFITWLVEHGANLNPDLREGGNKKSILQSSREEYKEFLVLHGAR